MSSSNSQDHNGSEPPNGSNGDTQPSGGLSEDQSKAVNDIVSKAIGARFKDFETKQAASQKKFGETLATSLTESIMGSIGQQLEALKPVEKGNEGGKGKTPENLDEHPRVKGLLKTVEQLQQRDKEREERETATAAQLKDSKLREKLIGLLSPHGIEGSRAQHAIGYLVDATKRVTWSEDGESLTFKDDSGDVIDAGSGLKTWVSSDDGKLYAPARNVSGSGERGTGGKAPVTSNGGKQPSTTEIGQGIANAFGITVS